jgi:WD40 repeat protein
MRRTVILACFAAACARPVSAPAPQPAEADRSTDIYLYRFSRLGRGSAVFNITNRIGYDNQPFWERNDRILYTAATGSQTEIRAIDFGRNTNSAVTSTPESEYSAALTPDGKSIAVIRVERDSTQRLWRFPRDGAAPSAVLQNIKPVGYFAWLDSTTLALYVLGTSTTPNTLQIADTRTGTGLVVTRGIGRSIQRIPGGRRASYVRSVGDRKFVLESVDPTSGPGFRIDTIAALPDSAEYVVWRSETEAYTAGGSRIYRLKLPSRSWTVVEDLAPRGIRGITRLALSPDGNRLALVADDGTNPQR